MFDRAVGEIVDVNEMKVYKSSMSKVLFLYR